MSLSKNHSDMLSAFCGEHVDYLVVGAHAMAALGIPRATGDLDIWVRPSAENAARVYRALAVFGAPLSGMSGAEFAEPDTVFQVGVVPERVDVLTSIDGVAFDTAWPERWYCHIAGIDVPIIAREHLIEK